MTSRARVNGDIVLRSDGNFFSRSIIRIGYLLRIGIARFLPVLLPS